MRRHDAAGGWLVSISARRRPRASGALPPKPVLALDPERRLLLVLSLCASVVCAGCDCGGGPATPDGGRVEDATAGGDAGPGDDAGRSDAGAVSCVRDPERIAARSECLGDDDCPCGTSCEVGACVAHCQSAADCESAERCDDFGRCRPAAHEAIVPMPPTIEGEGEVFVEEAAVVPEGAGEATLTIRTGEASEPVRVVAGDGTSLECTPGGASAAECDLGVVPAGTTVEITVTRDEAQLGDDAGEVDVFVGHDHDSVPVLRADQLPGSPLRETRPLAGVYEGALVAGTVGADLADPATPTRALPDVALPVRAEIWESGGALTVRIEDIHHALAHDGVLIGTATLSGAAAEDRTGSGAFPDELLVTGNVTSSAVDRIDVISSLRDVSVHVPREGGRVVIATRVATVGLGAGPLPYTSFTIDLVRRGDPSGDAEPSPAPAATRRVSEASQSHTGSYAAIEEAFPAYTDTRAGDAYQWLFGHYGLDQCFSFDGDHSNATPVWWGPVGAGGSDWRTDDGAALWLLADADPEELISSVTITNITLLSSSLAAGELACSGRVQVALRDRMTASPITTANVTFDRCAELEARTGCAPSTRTLFTPLYRTDVSGMRASTVGGPQLPLSGTLTLTAGGTTGICTLPPTPPFCGELATCLEPADATDLASVRGPILGTATVASGDLRCESGARIGTLAFDAGGLLASDSVETAIAELEAFASRTVPPAGPAEHGRRVRQVWSNERVIDPARLVVAAELGLVAQGSSGTVWQNGSARHGARLVERWVETHGLMAAEEVQRASLLRLIAASRLPGEPDPLLPDEVLPASMGGWDLLLHPAIASRLLSLPPAVLASPDYRLDVHGVVGRAGDEPRTSLPAAIMAALAQQLRLAEVVLEEAWLDGDAGPLPELQGLVSRVVAVRALAYALAARASADPASDGWREAMEQHSRATHQALRRAVSLARGIEEGRNPLGIEEEDLPLYFFDESTGPGGRFAAVSDFLAGTGPASPAWAPVLVASAEDAEGSARAAWVEEYERASREAFEARDHASWVESIRDRYNQTLRDYCGPIASSLVDDPAFDSSVCALNTADPVCNVETDAWYALFTEADFLGRLCMAERAEERCRMTTLPDETCADTWYPDVVREFATACYRPSGASTRVSLASCGGAPCLRCESASVPDLPLEPSTLQYRGELDDDYVVAREACRSAHPDMHDAVPLPRNPIEIPGCARGSIGETYLAVATADHDLHAARAEVDEHLEAYGIAMRSCLILEESNERLERARDRFVRSQSRLITTRATLDGIASTLGAAGDCLATLSGALGVDDFLTGGTVAAGVSCGLTVAAGALESAAIAVDSSIETAALEHEALVAELEASAEADICFNDARMELVGMRSANLRVEQAIVALRHASAKVQEQLEDAQRVWADGHAYLDQIEGFPVAPPTGELWSNELVDEWSDRFRLARRATYLAVRAVEYEFQASLALRHDALAARTTDDLYDVLREVWTTSATRSIGGSRPTDLHTVISLRDDVLRLGDESTRVTPGERALSPTERLRVMLADDRWAERDATGRLLGLRIPFSLSPLGALGLPTGGVPIYSTTDCAERLWSVNASILGEELWYGSDTTFTRIDLLKQNTFSSQWCGDAPADQLLQTASVRPERNLFREPGVGEGVSGAFAGTDGYARARIQAFFSVGRAELEDPSYASGETSELAARGLYGEYALFIPAELLSREASSGARTDGLALDHVDDILLRIDYVSVAR
jgi:hypothetical protein